ncbi:hypothetical protein, partial [Prevotella pectinovora]|uniref:hypothetical protein n=1 Tax=Prevotella pectinovora TaxID=1602169 RepID=UPI00307EA96A
FVGGLTLRNFGGAKLRITIIHNQSICPSPSGEVRWGLMTIFGVTSLIIFSPLSFSLVGEGRLLLTVWLSKDYP